MNWKIVNVSSLVEKEDWEILYNKDGLEIEGQFRADYLSIRYKTTKGKKSPLIYLCEEDSIEFSLKEKPKITFDLISYEPDLKQAIFYCGTGHWERTTFKKENKKTSWIDKLLRLWNKV